MSSRSVLAVLVLALVVVFQGFRLPRLPLPVDSSFVRYDIAVVAVAGLAGSNASYPVLHCTIQVQTSTALASR